jgi:predicted phage terminase large subunit-like protein
MINPVERYRERTRETLLNDFGAFCRRAWREIEPSTPLLWSWHHELVCEYLTLCYEREITRLIITMPPRGLKSKLVSVFFGAWVWAKSPGQSFILTSYSDALSEELNMARRTLLTSKWYQDTFPGKVQFTADQNRREKYRNTAGGQSVATSTEGTLTGLGADYLLVDDLLSPQQSYSDALRLNANRFFDSSLRSRLNSPTTGAIVIVCQRLHESDLPGYLLEAEPGTWTHLNLPMECEADTEIEFPLSGRRMLRQQGDLLHPARWPKSWVEKQKRVMGSFVWSGQFQQRPAPAGGAIFKSEWFQRYKKDPEKGSTIISLDTAFSTKKTADYSCASVWQAHEGKFYLRYVWRARVAYPELKRVVEEFADTWRPDAVLVEEKASGQSLVQSLREETTLPVVGIQADVDKVSRAHSVTALFSAGRIFFPDDAPWLAAYFHELELFPNSSFDDQVDTTTMALRYLRAQGYDGGLTFIATCKEAAADWLRGVFVFGGKKRPASNGSAPPAGPVETRCEPIKAELAFCEVCKTKNVGVHPDGHGKTLCRQCGAVCGVRMTPVETPGHVHKWRVIPGNQMKCDDCEEQRFIGDPPTTNGAKFGDLPGSKFPGGWSGGRF